MGEARRAWIDFGGKGGEARGWRRICPSPPRFVIPEYAASGATCGYPGPTPCSGLAQSNCELPPPCCGTPTVIARLLLDLNRLHQFAQLAEAAFGVDIAGSLKGMASLRVAFACCHRLINQASNKSPRLLQNRCYVTAINVPEHLTNRRGLKLPACQN